MFITVNVVKINLALLNAISDDCHPLMAIGLLKFQCVVVIIFLSLLLLQWKMINCQTE